MKYLKYSISILIFLSIFFIGQYLIELSLEKIIENSSFRYSRLYTQKLENDVISIGIFDELPILHINVQSRARAARAAFEHAIWAWNVAFA